LIFGNRKRIEALEAEVRELREMIGRRAPMSINAAPEIETVMGVKYYSWRDTSRMVTVEQAILALASHLGVEFKVQQRSESVTLEKVKK
jgi:hypothetical protein